MQVFGLSDELVDAPTEAEIEPDTYEVWPDNVSTLSVFLSLRTQWDIVAAPDGELVRTGLKYDRAEVVLRNTNGIPKRAWVAILADLRSMEYAALRVMNADLRKVRDERAEEMRNRTGR